MYSWKDALENQKLFLVSNLILKTIEGLRTNNPVLFVLVPFGVVEEFGAFWESHLLQFVQEVKDLPVDSPKRKYYFPEIRESDVETPILWTTRDERTGQLMNYFEEKVIARGKDSKRLLAALPGDPHDVLLGFYLSTELLEKESP